MGGKEKEFSSDTYFEGLLGQPSRDVRDRGGNRLDSIEEGVSRRACILVPNTLGRSSEVRHVELPLAL